MTGTGTAVDPLRVVSSPSVAWGSITGTLSAQTDLQDALDGKVNTPISTTRENLYDTLIAEVPPRSE